MLWDAKNFNHLQDIAISPHFQKRQGAVDEPYA